MQSLADTIEARMEEILRNETLAPVRPRSTITPGPRSDDVQASEAVAQLGELAPGAIVLGDTLGEGGMGVVRGARQLSLHREVAVKTLKPDHRSESAKVKLLREAWVTGALEHPNVVPVYDVGLEADGSPRIVLKKIVGRSWEDLMRDGAEVKRRFHASDLLEWNLRTLMQVAGAVHFAHGRGILHRDLKPENVMVGEHGEIYVVDWGIAVALRDDGSGRLPLAADATEMAGTPCYMAPEMLGGRPGLLTARTDVYLLGAMLYEVVMGRAPHDGESLMAILHQVARSEPPLSESVPQELSRIVRVAMDADPHARFESAEQVRLALAGFLEHRFSMQLSSEAQERLEELEAERQNTGGDADDRRLHLYHLFGECRFGFLHALKAWRDNVEAQRGLRRAIETMIEVELELDDPRAAALLLSDLDSPPPDLAARVHAAREAREREDARLDALAREHDPALGRRTRAFVAVLMGTLWTVMPLVTMTALYVTGEQANHLYSVIGTLGLMGIGGALAYWARESMSRTAVNRRVVSIATLAFIGQLMLFLGSWVSDTSMQQTLPILPLIYTVSTLAACVAIDWRLWPSALAFAGSYAISSVYFPAFYVVEALANLALTVNLVVLWTRLREDVVEPIQRNRDHRRARFREFLGRLEGRALPPEQ